MWNTAVPPLTPQMGYEGAIYFRCQLRYREELRIKDIALRLNRSEGTVKSHLHHAHRKLRDLLRPYLQNEPLGWLRTS